MTCVNVYRCARVEVKGYFQVFLRLLCTLFFEIEFLMGLRLANLARLAGQLASGILPLPPQHWDYKCMLCTQLFFFFF